MYVVSELFTVTAADIEARTLKHKQTPLHFAAKNDAVGGVRMLLQHGADIAVRDYKERTPLQLAAIFGKAFISSSHLQIGPSGAQTPDLLTRQATRSDLMHVLKL